MKKRFLFVALFYSLITMLVSTSCSSSHVCGTVEDEDGQRSVRLVERVDSCGLMLLFPSYDKVDLVCGTMPSAKDSTAVLCAEACFTGQCLKVFDHFNVAGDHVSHGVRYHGFRCKRNTGAFVYYNHQWKFFYGNYSAEMDKAAKHGGAAFAQEMIIHKNKLVESVRKDSNRNQFRALCEIGGKLCVAESKRVVTYGDFKQSLMEVNASEALYLDMGSGWNHAWYKAYSDSVIVLHPKTHNYCTNWITFYEKH